MPTLTATQPAAQAVAKPQGLIQRILDTLLVWQRRASERHQLMTMDEAMLKDLGVSRLDAEYEGSKPFWRA